jgi:hypothetical protein
MRLIVTTAKGIRYGGRTYRKGEEMEMPDTKPDREWAVAFLAKKWAKKHEPVVLGTAPRQQRVVEERVVLTEGPPPPAGEPMGTWGQSPWKAEEAAQQPAQQTEEPSAESEQTPEETPADDPHLAHRRRRSLRRDITPEQ